MVMRLLVWLTAVLAVVWGGYWFVGSRALERSTEGWFASQAAEGRVAERESVSVQGFPSRFDLTITAPRLADPATGWGWSAPFVQVLTLSYTPWHWVAAFAPEQEIDTPFDRMSLTSNRLQASLSVVPGMALTLDEFRLIGDRLSLSSDMGWLIGADTLRFATRQIATDGREHALGMEILGLAPDAALSAALPDMPAAIERVHLDAGLRFTAPIDRNSGTSNPQIEAVDLKEALLIWGDLAIHGKGKVTADAAGYAEGRIDLRLTNWRRLPPLAVALGAIRPEVQPTWENMMTVLAQQSGNPDVIDLPLVFRNGRMSVGPLPLGPAPRLN